MVQIQPRKYVLRSCRLCAFHPAAWARQDWKWICLERSRSWNGYRWSVRWSVNFSPSEIPKGLWIYCKNVRYSYIPVYAPLLVPLRWNKTYSSSNQDQIWCLQHMWRHRFWVRGTFWLLIGAWPSVIVPRRCPAVLLCNAFFRKMFQPVCPGNLRVGVSGMGFNHLRAEAMAISISPRPPPPTL